MGKRKLVPLMPILVALRACREAREWIEQTNHATFRKTWFACPEASWLCWLANQHQLRLHGPGRCCCDLTPAKARSRLASGGATARAVERALYDYAVREGLVP